jgi:hypothetical protein
MGPTQIHSKNLQPYLVGNEVVEKVGHGGRYLLLHPLVCPRTYPVGAISTVANTAVLVVLDVEDDAVPHREALHHRGPEAARRSAAVATSADAASDRHMGSRETGMTPLYPGALSFAARVPLTDLRPRSCDPPELPSEPQLPEYRLRLARVHPPPVHIQPRWIPSLSQSPTLIQRDERASR